MIDNLIDFNTGNSLSKHDLLKKKKKMNFDFMVTSRQMHKNMLKLKLHRIYNCKL